MRTSQQFIDNTADHDIHMLRMSKRFSKIYILNIYKLNKVGNKSKQACKQYQPNSIYLLRNLNKFSLINLNFCCLITAYLYYSARSKFSTGTLIAN